LKKIYLFCIHIRTNGSAVSDRHCFSKSFFGNFKPFSEV
jgi:hypothetical protein